MYVSRWTRGQAFIADMSDCVAATGMAEEGSSAILNFIIEKVI